VAAAAEGGFRGMLNSPRVTAIKTAKTDLERRT
jgi:hypothetical protein